MNLRKENEELKARIKAYESYYGKRLASLCLLCGCPINSQNKISIIHHKDYESHTIGHYHPKCWDKKND